MRDGDWYWISRMVYEDYASRIGVIGLALYNAYASYARDKGLAFPSQKTISKRLRVSISSVRKYNKILEANGLIKIESGKVRGKPNVITLLKIEGGQPITTGSPSDSYRGSCELSTKENNNKENTKVAEQSSPVKEVFSYFRSKVREAKGFDPEINWAKDGRLIKLRLKKYGSAQIKDLIDWYLTSNFSEKLGVSLATCLSTYVINLWKAGIASQPSYPFWKPPKP